MKLSIDLVTRLMARWSCSTMLFIDADVGAQLAGFDGVEQLVVDGGACLGLRDLENAFTERVKRDFDAFGVELGGGGDRLIDRHTGDETA